MSNLTEQPIQTQGDQEESIENNDINLEDEKDKHEIKNEVIEPKEESIIESLNNTVDLYPD